MTLSPLDILSISIHWSLYLRLGFFRNTQSMHILCLSQLTVLFGHCMRTVLLSLPLRYSADERKCTHIMNSANISVLVALLKLLNMGLFFVFYGAKELLILAWLTWYELSDLIIILMFSTILRRSWIIIIPRRGPRTSAEPRRTDYKQISFFSRRL